MLNLEGIDVGYGDVQVLWDVSLEVREGEFVALLGANGAGKTTTLNAISGLLRPRKGTIAFLGQDLARTPAFRRAELGIAHVPEGRRLFPEMSVRENLEMGALHGEARRRRRETMEEVFSIFPRLRERQHQLAGSLSGGEQQMLAIGRGLMGRPKLLLLDEPSLGLAPMLVAQVFQVVRELHSRGMTILLVEQNVRHALEVCSRAYVLENGRIVLQGTGAELLANPHVREAYLGI
jgi:branched-chain amino acid transport system ATP-binding protein